MGKLHDMSRLVASAIDAGRTPIEQVRLRGAIAVKAGFLVTLVSAEDPDDPDRIYALRLAARDVLGLQL